MWISFQSVAWRSYWFPTSPYDTRSHQIYQDWSMTEIVGCPFNLLNVSRGRLSSINTLDFKSKMNFKLPFFILNSGKHPRLSSDICKHPQFLNTLFGRVLKCCLHDFKFAETSLKFHNILYFIRKWKLLAMEWISNCHRFHHRTSLGNYCYQYH